MGSKTSIGWTQSDDGREGATWNAMRGCSRTIAEGAEQSGCGDASGGGCYAERNGWRFAGPGLPYEGLVRMTPTGARWTGKVKLVDKHLLDPVRWVSPRRIFTTSVSDPFHERYTNETIAVVFGVMVITPHHIHQCLTKRAKRMREWFAWLEREAASCNAGVGMSPAAYCFSLLQRYVQHAELDYAFRFTDTERKLVARGDLVEAACKATWPLENVWLGVSCENQPATNERVPMLLKTPAAIRFLSCEPLIGPIDLENVRHRLGESSFETGSVLEGNDGFGLSAPRNAIDWVISGTESGPGARACDVEWLRLIRDQCERAGVAHFLKQANEDLTPVVVAMPQDRPSVTVPTIAVGPSSKRKGSDGTLIDLPYLDGKQHSQFPQVPHAA